MSELAVLRQRPESFRVAALAQNWLLRSASDISVRSCTLTRPEVRT